MLHAHFRRTMALACAVLWLGGFVCGEEVAADAERFDGIYFLHGGRRVLRIEKNGFRLRNCDSYYYG